MCRRRHNPCLISSNTTILSRISSLYRIDTQRATPPIFLNQNVSIVIFGERLILKHPINCNMFQVTSDNGADKLEVFPKVNGLSIKVKGCQSEWNYVIVQEKNNRKSITNPKPFSLC